MSDTVTVRDEESPSGWSTRLVYPAMSETTRLGGIEIISNYIAPRDKAILTVDKKWIVMHPYTLVEMQNPGALDRLDIIMGMLLKRTIGRLNMAIVRLNMATEATSD